MKRLIFAVACLFTMLNAQAQGVESDFSASDTDLSEMANTKTADNNGISADIRIPDGGKFGISVSYTGFDYFNIGYFNDWLSTKGLEKNEDMGLFAGGMYRYWIIPAFYVEGRAGLDFHWQSFSIKVPETIGTSTYESTKSDDDFSLGFYVEPRIGVKVYEKDNSVWSINAGYRFDALEFKFDKSHLRKYIVVGVTLSF